MKKRTLTLGLALLAASTIFASGCASEKTPAADTINQNANNQINMQTQIPEAGEEIAILVTDMGEISIQLFPEVAPQTVKNFKELTKQEKYKDVPIHRVIDDFMIQTGDFENGNGTGGYSYKGPGTTIPDEPSPKLKHIYGALSMAKTALPNSGGSQFFIVQNKNGTEWLDGVHTVFGQVIKGMDIVEEISNTETGANDKPVQEILLKSVKLVEYEGA